MILSSFHLLQLSILNLYASLLTKDLFSINSGDVISFLVLFKSPPLTPFYHIHQTIVILLILNLNYCSTVQPIEFATVFDCYLISIIPVFTVTILPAFNAFVPITLCSASLFNDRVVVSCHCITWLSILSFKYTFNKFDWSCSWCWSYSRVLSYWYCSKSCN